MDNSSVYSAIGEPPLPLAVPVAAAAAVAVAVAAGAGGCWQLKCVPAQTSCGDRFRSRMFPRTYTHRAREWGSVSV
eukprot:COSAG03_NODE_5525_length_1228_cov_106.959256_2_plen_76_part_00